MKSPTSNRQKLECPWCGTTFYRHPSQITGKNTCSRKCQAESRTRVLNPDGYKDFIDTTGMSKNMTRINRRLNPARMTPEVRAKIRAALVGTGEGKTYEKNYGRHTHRVVAEQKIGRPLRRGEVVHHIDGNKRNNHPDNLEVMTQAEHIELHRKRGDLKRRGE